MSDHDTGAVEEPDTGFQLGDDIIGSVGDGLAMLIDIFSAVLRVYLITTTMLLLSLFVLFVVMYFMRQWPDRYGTQLTLRRTRRSAIGLFIVCLSFPILYLAAWLGTGSTSSGDLPSDSVFGTSFEERFINIGFEPDGLELSVDFLVAVTGIYLRLTTTLLFVASVLMIALYLIPKLSPFGEKLYRQQSRRIFYSFFAVSILLPVLYLIVWAIAGEQSVSGYDLESDGVFGTSLEDRLLGPEIGESGFGQLISILSTILETYRVSITFIMLSLFVFSVVVYAAYRWPRELNDGSFEEHLYRAAIGLMLSLTFIPILYMIGWLAVGLYRPDESLTRVAPQISLPYEEVFQGPRYHPFIDGMEASMDPVEVFLHTLIEIQITTLLYVGVLALIFGVLVYAFLAKANVLQTNLGQQSFRGGVIIIVVVFLAPGIVTGAAWIASGVPDDGYLGDGPPGYSSECTDFEDADIEDWDVVEGTASATVDPAGIEVDGTIAKDFPELAHGDRSVTVTTITSDEDVHIRVYDDDGIALNETIQNDASFTFGTTGEVTVEISSSGAELAQACAGFAPSSDPQVDVHLFEPDEELILHEDFSVKYGVYNVGEVPTGTNFTMAFGANGTDPWGNEARSREWHDIEPLDGGQFIIDPVYFANDTITTTYPPVGDVEVTALVDPEEELDERTTIPNRDWIRVTILYGNFFADVDATLPTVNTTNIETSTLNNGTTDTESTPANLTIYDEDNDGEVVTDWDISLDPIPPESTFADSFEHTFETPGNYSVEYDVHDRFFPTGSSANDTINIFAGDLRGDLENVDDTARVGHESTFDVRVENHGNDEFGEPADFTVDLIRSDGSVSQSQQVTIPNLEPGEQHVETVSIEPDEGGQHTIELDVHDPHFPIGSTDSASITGIGPNLDASVSTSTVHIGEEPDVTVEVENTGTDDAAETSLTAAVVDDGGDVIQEDELDVPSLNAGESYSVSLFDEPMEEDGDYDVELTVDPTPDTTGAEADGEFEVVFSDVSLDVDAHPIGGTNEVDVGMVLENHGTGETSDNNDFEIWINDSNDNVVDTETGQTSSLSAGERRVINRTLELEDSGSHVAVGEVEIDGLLIDSDPFEHSWPDLGADIEATETEVEGSSTDVETTVTNFGDEESSSTSASVTVFDMFGSVVDSHTFDVSPIHGGGSQEDTVTISFPEEGNYTAQLDVDDREFPENTTDTTETIEVFLSELVIEADEDESQVPVGEDGVVDATVRNHGGHTSSAGTMEVTFVDPNGNVVEEFEESFEPLDPDEETTETFETTLDTAGIYDITTDAKTDEWDVTDSTQIEAIESDLAMSIEAVDEQIAIGEEGEWDVEINNHGTAESEERSLSITVEDGDGSVVQEWDTTVDSIPVDESDTVEFTSESLDEEGEYTAIAELEMEDEPLIDSDSLEVIPPTLNADIESNDIEEGEQVDVETTIENIAPTESDSTTATVVLREGFGDTIAEEEIGVEPLEQGERQTDEPFDEVLDDPDEYEVEIGIDSEDSDMAEDDDTFSVGFWDLEVEVTADDQDREQAHEVVVDVSNVGDITSEETTADVVITGPSGEKVVDETLEIPPIGGGNTHTEIVEFEAEEGGEHTVDVDVEDAERPDGTQDSDSFVVVWGDLQASIDADDVVESNRTDFDISVTNVGPGESYSTTAEVEVLDSFGNVMDRMVIDIPEIEPGEQYDTSVPHTFPRPDNYQGLVDVEYPEYPDGTIDTTRSISIIHGNLETEVEVTDPEVVVREEGSFEVTVTNTGNDDTDPTSLDVDVTNNRGERVFEESLLIEGLEAGEETTRELSSLIDDRGEHTVTAEVDYPTFPIGNEDTGSIEGISPDLRTDLDVDDAELGEETEFRIDVENVGEVPSNATDVEVKMFNSQGDRVVREFFEVDSVNPGDSITLVESQLIAEECWRTEMSCEPGAEMDTGIYTATADVDTEYAPEGSKDEDEFVVEG